MKINVIIASWMLSQWGNITPYLLQVSNVFVPNRNPITYTEYLPANKKHAQASSAEIVSIMQQVDMIGEKCNAVIVLKKTRTMFIQIQFNHWNYVWADVLWTSIRMHDITFPVTCAIISRTSL